MVSFAWPPCKSDFMRGGKKSGLVYGRIEMNLITAGKVE